MAWAETNGAYRTVLDINIEKISAETVEILFTFEGVQNRSS